MKQNLKPIINRAWIAALMLFSFMGTNCAQLKIYNNEFVEE